VSKYDLVILGFLAFFAFIGFIRGFIIELFEAVGIILAIIFGHSWAVKVGPHLPGALPDYMRVPLATFVLSILIVFVVKAIGGGISRKVKKTPLKPVNSFLGGFAGVGKGMVLIILLLALISFTPAQRIFAQIKGPAPVLNWAIAKSKPIIKNYGGKAADAAKQPKSFFDPAPAGPITAEERAAIEKLLKDPTIKALNLTEAELRQLAAKMKETEQGAAGGR